MNAAVLLKKYFVIGKFTIPLLYMLEAAHHYIRDQSGLELTCEISSFSWLGGNQLFAMTDHGHWYLVYGRLFYVRWLSFYRGYIR